MNVIGESATLQDAIPSLASRKPSVVLYNLVTSLADLFRAIQRFQTYTVPTVMYPPRVNNLFIDSALFYGAAAYLNSDHDADALLAMLRDAARGIPHLSPDMLESRQRMMYRELMLGRLSRREFEVLEFIANGMSNHQIAVEIDISISTVKKHVSSVLGRFETENRTKAVTIALRNRVID
jgi:DNA-binding NarL/FixJ family response regulator